MKNIIIMLMFVLAYSTASAQVNKKVTPSPAVTPPGTPPIEDLPEKVNREFQRDAAATPGILKPAGNATSQPVSPQAKEPAASNTMVSPYPGKTFAYPSPQRVPQPGTGITTGEATGTNNPLNTLPASNTTNQGKF